MQILTEEIRHFLHSQNFIVVSTIDKNGRPHSSCKGLVNIDEQGKICLLDLYRSNTYRNLNASPNMSITAIDEHKFKGYCLKGRAKITAIQRLDPKIIKAWENKITTRITQRVIKNIVGEKGNVRHPEALLPKPQYLIVMEVDEIVDLTPHHIKLGA